LPGGIADAGLLSRNIAADINLKKRFASSLISAQTALDGLDWTHDAVGRQTTAGCAIARIDWTMAKRELAAVRTPTFGAIGAPAGTRHAVDGTAIVERLRALPTDEATDALVEIVVEEIALRFAAKGGRPASSAGRDRHGLADDARAAHHGRRIAGHRPAHDVHLERDYPDGCRAPHLAAHHR
jgi:hypothetical protein